MAIAGPLLIVAERDGEWARFLREHRGASALDPEGRWVFFSVPRRAEAPPVCTSGVVALAAASDNRGSVPIAAITDGNRLTFWTLGRPQQVGDMLTLDLGRVATPCAVTLSQLGFEASYPRTLTVATSLDGSAWQTAFAGKTGGLLVRAVLASPLERSLDIPLPESPARFIRLRLDEATERDAWVVA